MKERTANQRAANLADMDLYRLILRAEQNGWADVIENLQAARRELRKKMHMADRQGTEGSS